MRPQWSDGQTVAMDIRDTFIAANSALTDLVLRVRSEQLSLEAPAYARFHDGQTLRDSLNLMAYENQCVPKVLAGATGLVTNPEFDGDLLGDDLAGNYERLAVEANASVRAHTDLERIVHISYGDVPAARYLSDISLNRTMALYDAAALTGLEPHMSDEALGAVHAIAAGSATCCDRWGSSRRRSPCPTTRHPRTDSWATSAGSPGDRSGVAAPGARSARTGRRRPARPPRCDAPASVGGSPSAGSAVPPRGRTRWRPRASRPRPRRRWASA